jgi:uncharacterized protein (TIGR03067 family)
MLRRTLMVALVLAMGYAVAEEKKTPSLAGKWKIVSGVKDGEKISTEKLGTEPLDIQADKMILKTPEATFNFSYKLNAKTSPIEVDMTIESPDAFKGSKALGIVAMDGKKAKLAYNPMGGDRPKNFDAKAGSGEFSFELEKQ